MARRKPREDWVRIAVERCVRSIEEWRSHEVFGTGDAPHIRVVGAVAAWGSRYQTRRDQIDSIRSVDPWLHAAILDRCRRKDAVWTGRPGWTEEMRPYTEGSTMTRWTQCDAWEPHPHGPSLRQVWLAAERAGGDIEQVLDALIAWGHAPAKPLEAEASDWLDRELTWTLTGETDHPWHAEAQGHTLTLRLEDFPEVAPWTLLVDGLSAGVVYGWPPLWHRGAAPQPTPEPRVAEGADRWLSRYEAGEHEAVWRELREAGERLRDPDHLDAARAVARETMRRVRHNAELLIPRLREAGYHFGPAAGDPEPITLAMGPFSFTLPLALGSGAPSTPSPPHLPPAAEDPEALEALTDAGFVLPLALEAFIREVGALDLTGSHPVINPRGVRRPIALFPFAHTWAEALEEHADLWQEEGEPVEMSLMLGAEDTAAMAQGRDEQWEPLTVRLPDAGADVRIDRTEVWLVDYLRAVFAGGGFTGWSQGPRPSEVEALTRDLLAF